jgi:hypothetical protein
LNAATLAATAILIRESLNIEGCFCWYRWGSEGELMIGTARQVAASSDWNRGRRDSSRHSSRLIRHFA